MSLATKKRCQCCGRAKGHNRNCPRAIARAPKVTTADDLLTAFVEGLRMSGNDGKSIQHEDAATAQVNVDGGLWEITVRRVL
jgi:hypothetical protein